MPWYQSPKASAGVEVSLTYQFFNGGPNGNKLHRKRSAAFVKIDRHNVSVIGMWNEVQGVPYGLGENLDLIIGCNS